MLDMLYYIIPLCIVITVSVLLLVLFRVEVKNALLTCTNSIILHLCIVKEILKDISGRKKNVTEVLSQPGKVAVITGARGIGSEVIKKLLQSNMTVIIGCRDVPAGLRTLDEIRNSGVKSGEGHCYTLDLMSLKSVKKFADLVLTNHPEIHLLVNNAGVMETNRSVTDEGFEKTFAVNYLSHCYLSHLLLPRLAATARTGGGCARIVNVSSVAHCFPVMGKMRFQDLMLRWNYQKYTAYSQSKLAQLMFTIALDARLRSQGLPVRVYAIHPGIVLTTMTQDTVAHRVWGCVYPLLLRTPEEGARSVYHACVSPQLEPMGGAYIYNCTVTTTGRSARCVDDHNKLWTVMMKMLDLRKFGGIIP